MNSVPTITLNTDATIPLIGFGTWKLHEGGEVQEALRLALDAGYRHVDTAAYYGNEKGVGEALRDSHIPRSDLFVTTKVWNADQGYDTTLKAFDTSLHRLGLEYVDLYLVHWPVAKKFKDTWRALEQLYQQGVVRAIGVSNFQPHHLDDLLTVANVVPALNQVELHPLLAQKELREYCAEKGIAVEAWSPLMRGSHELQDPIIADIATRHAKSPAQIVLRWHAQQQIIAIPKSSHPDRIRENIDIFDFELTEQDMQELDRLDVGKRFGPDPDNFNF